ncbi:protein of unknown function [Kyrpidia spormannii]|uniref:Uncharacterized protein n=2 Tax=Kyrpidia spormannii TaxID=2055160 RepID=A0ACA8Z8B4_9BACL|nr:protein of unknown function [Kyrpidia spormannii]CAB3392599.1 protein of unknown function [Kyrpidia spormannii]
MQRFGIPFLVLGLVFINTSPQFICPAQSWLGWGHTLSNGDPPNAVCGARTRGRFRLFLLSISLDSARVSFHVG